MGTLLALFAALGVLQTVIEILTGFPQLRAFWRAARGAPAAVGRRLDRAAVNRMPAIRPGVVYPPEVIRRRERLSRARRLAEWLMKSEPARPLPTRISYRERQTLRALGLDDVIRRLEGR